MMSAPSTPGTSHTPYMKPCAGGKPAKAAAVVFHSWPHAQKTTPKATASDDATTMSTVRQRRRETAGSAVVGGRTVVGLVMAVLPTPCAGITQIRYEGLRALPHSQR